MTKKQYWYTIDVYTCVLCGLTTTYRERTTNKTKAGTHHHDCACPTHF